MNANHLSATYADSKPHYHILDGLRGVAALLVVWYHIFEAFATSPLDQIVNHGYLAVDFFFLLSGFVVAYAYDDRQISIGGFLKRRLIRLHPMVVMGSLIGGLLFFVPVWCNWMVEGWKIYDLTTSTFIGGLILNTLLIPATASGEIRGFGEMFPVNGPAWSLFFEYLGNIIYILILRKLPTRIIGYLVAFLGVGLTAFAITSTNGYIGAGWTLTEENFLGGSLRLLFSFTAGIFISRTFVPMRFTRGFWLCALILAVVTLCPRVGDAESLWKNGIYDALVAIVVFPIVLNLGASAKVTTPWMDKLCRFLGDISYPLYIIHYPFLYLYFAWVKNGHLTFPQSIGGALALFFGCILLAWVCLKVYDAPLRRMLTARFLSK